MQFFVSSSNLATFFAQPAGFVPQHNNSQPALIGYPPTGPFFSHSRLHPTFLGSACFPRAFNPPPPLSVEDPPQPSAEPQPTTLATDEPNPTTFTDEKTHPVTFADEKPNPTNQEML